MALLAPLDLLVYLAHVETPVSRVQLVLRGSKEVQVGEDSLETSGHRASGEQQVQLEIRGLWVQLVYKDQLDC
jgi:hypothetical protein